MSCWNRRRSARTPTRSQRCAGQLSSWKGDESEDGQVRYVHDVRLNAGHGSPDHVGDIWHDDYANGTDGRCRRLLCGGGAVLSTRRGAEEQEKKKALNRPKYQRQRNYLRL